MEFVRRLNSQSIEQSKVKREDRLSYTFTEKIGEKKLEFLQEKARAAILKRARALNQEAAAAAVTEE